MTDAVWSAWRTWGALRLSGQEILAADEASRAHLSRRLDLEALDVLEATVTHEAWLDGARVHGRLKAVATRLCGVSLEPFEERVDTGFDFRFVPEGSPNSPAPEDEIIVTLETDDPPELVKGGAVDLAAYIVEALILALDPFPRKPGVVFDYVDPSPEASPFAILKFPGHDRQT